MKITRVSDEYRKIYNSIVYQEYFIYNNRETRTFMEFYNCYKY